MPGSVPCVCSACGDQKKGSDHQVLFFFKIRVSKKSERVDQIYFKTKRKATGKRMRRKRVTVQ